jgi:integrase
MSSSAVANVLEQAIQLSGLDGLGFTAKSFRPTGATHAIDSNLDPNIVQHVGRWKSRDVFYQHYVHYKPPVCYVDFISQSVTHHMFAIHVSPY